MYIPPVPAPKAGLGARALSTEYGVHRMNCFQIQNHCTRASLLSVLRPPYYTVSFVVGSSPVPTPAAELLKVHPSRTTPGREEESGESHHPLRSRKAERGCHRLSQHATLMVSHREALVSFAQMNLPGQTDDTGVIVLSKVNKRLEQEH